MVIDHIMFVLKSLIGLYIKKQSITKKSVFA